jgi:hypothetical protein
MLVLSACQLSTSALKNVLLANVDPVASLSGLTITGGRLNVNRAIRNCSGAPPPPAPPGTASFVKTDSSTMGTWKGVYGGDGANVIGDSAGYPSYVTVTPTSQSLYTWAASTTDVRGMQKRNSFTDRIAACWTNTAAFSIDLNFTDGNPHQVALYMLDWSAMSRQQRVDILNSSGNVLDSRTVSSFVNGQYLVWNLSGRVTIRVTKSSGPNAVVSGLLFGGPGSVTPPPAAGTAAFLRTDTTTAGSWKGVYGADGANVIGDSAAYPSYATVTPAGQSAWIWAASTTDVRATQKRLASDRVAACWYSKGTFGIDLNFTDAGTHQVALYMLDWDGHGGRRQRVEIRDAMGTLLDTRNVTGFDGGQYLVWNVSGRVTIHVTNTNSASNAVVSGLFFR